MHKVVNYFRKRQHLLVLGLILAVGLFFRTYQVIERFEFAHDGDLYSWIVKDIVINGHFRLIGQETSTSGIFIGPAFYYLITPFFLLTNMDPVGATILITIIGVLTVLSYYIVFSKLFNIEVGLIAAFLYATLLATVGSDRWVVPSTSTNLWVIWYFYIVIMLARGNFTVLPILGILIGLIWHIHIALLPGLIAVPVAIFTAKRLPTPKQILIFLVVLFVTSLPLLFFEIKNGFPQTTSLISNFYTPRPGIATGLYKFQQVLQMITKNINTLLFTSQPFKFTNNILFILLVLLSALWLVKRKLITLKELIPMCAWILGVVLFFSITSSPISEYYFRNIEVIFFVILSLFLYIIFRLPVFGKSLLIALMLLIFLKNAVLILTQNDSSRGYLERKATATFIVHDVKNKGYPCVGINYITSPGENVGFRYFFFLNNLHTVPPSNNVPVYSIVIPSGYSAKEVEKIFGNIGVITPKNIPSVESIKFHCSGGNSNLTDPMFGYVE